MLNCAFQCDHYYHIVVVVVVVVRQTESSQNRRLWIPSHCNLPGNEAADSLAKEGTTKEQVDRSTSYPEVKTILKAKQHSKWRHKHPRYNKADPYYLLTRRETSYSIQA